MSQQHVIHITNYCNLNCVHCSQPKTDEFMSLFTAKQISKQIPIGDEIILTGGEPTLNIDVINEFKKTHVENLSIITNGSNLNLDFSIFKKVEISTNEFEYIDNIKLIAEKNENYQVNVLVDNFTINNLLLHWEKIKMLKLEFLINPLVGVVSKETINKFMELYDEFLKIQQKYKKIKCMDFIKDMQTLYDRELYALPFERIQKRYWIDGTIFQMRFTYDNKLKLNMYLSEDGYSFENLPENYIKEKIENDCQNCIVPNNRCIKLALFDCTIYDKTLKNKNICGTDKNYCNLQRKMLESELIEETPI